MKTTKAIPLSIVVLLVGGLMGAIVLSFALNLQASIALMLAMSAGAVFMLTSVGFFYWVARELEKSEERLRVIVDSTHDGIITTNKMGLIDSVNASVTDLFGYRPGKLLGEHVSMLLSSAHSAGVEGETFHSFLEREKMGVLGTSYVVRGLRQDGHQFHMDFTVSEARLGGELFFTVMVRDVTERVTAQVMLNESRNELERRVKERTAALEESNERLYEEITRRKELIQELQLALGDIKTLSGLLPICSSCKKIRDDQGYWSQIEVFIREHSDAEFSHSVCPECIEQLYPGLHVPHSD